MRNIIETVKAWWAKSTGFRHYVTAWLAIQVAIPLAQVGAWAQAKAAHDAIIPALPNFASVGMDIIYAGLAALIAAWFKWWQNKRAFPPVNPQ